MPQCLQQAGLDQLHTFFHLGLVFRAKPPGRHDGRPVVAYHLLVAAVQHKASGSGPGPFDGPVGVDETLVGSNENNNHANRREPNASGPVGETFAIGTKDRETNRINARVIGNTDGDTLHSFVENQTNQYTTVFTDDHRPHEGSRRPALGSPALR